MLLEDEDKDQAAVAPEEAEMDGDGGTEETAAV